jgi:hypothetical protein
LRDEGLKSGKVIEQKNLPLFGLIAIVMQLDVNAEAIGQG